MSVSTFITPSRLGLFSTATFTMIQFLAIAIYPAIAQAADIHLSDVVLCFTLGSMIFLWSSPFWSQRSDTKGRLPILRVGLTGLAVSFALLIFITEADLKPTLALAILLLSRVLYGVFASSIVGVVQAWWRDQNRSATQSMLSHSLGLNLGRFLAPLLVLALGARLGLVLWVVFAWCALLALIAIKGRSKSVTVQPVVSPVHDIKAYWAFAIAFVTMLFTGAIHGTLAGIIQDVLEMNTLQTARVVSQALLLSATVALLSQSALRRFGRLRPRTLLTIGSSLLVIAGFLFSSISSSTGVWISVSVFALALSTITPGYLALQGAGGKNAGRMGSIQTLGLALGGVLGALVLKEWLPLSSVLLFLAFGLLTLCGFTIRSMPEEL